jgi:hypothetical protein
MKSTKNLVSTAVLIAGLFSVTFTSVSTVAQTQKVPTKKELISLLKTAKEPPEHLRIAAYYKQEAARQRHVAKDHSEMAEAYQKTVPFLAMEAKHGDAFGLAAPHCRKWSALALEQAKEDDALAALHEGMAKVAEQKQ